MIELTFSKSGREDIVLTEDDLFDFGFERGCFSGDTFELGGVSAKSIYMIIDNNTQRFPRGAFANCRVRLDIDGHFCGHFNSELPKRRNGVIELTVYDDMIKLDTEFPEDCEFPSLFWTVYAHCLLKAGLADHFSVENGDIFVLNALFNVGVISHEYTDYIYANSCRNVISGMAEWNGGFAYINDDGKLQVDVFSKEVSKTFYSSELMDFDYSDETVVFSKIKTSQKNKTYEMGDDSGYTLIINNQYIGYGLDDADFEMYLGFIYDYYKEFSLTPMSFTLAEPDFSLKIGDRISVVDEEENVTVTGNISEITVSGNCSMTVTCGGFGNVSGVVNYNKTSTGQNNQIKAETAQASSAGAVTSYEYLSDPSVKLNGTTYTIEKNAAGLITKITDSLGNALKPTISGEITEIPLHNAALLGAVLARGIGKYPAYIARNPAWNLVGDPGITMLSLSDEWLVTKYTIIEVCATYTLIVNTSVNKARFFEATLNSTTTDALFAFSLFGEIFEYAINKNWQSGGTAGLNVLPNTVNTISLVISGSNQRLYCNGEYISTNTNTIVDKIGQYVKCVYIRSASLTDTRNLDGTIYALRVYNTALSESEIKQNYAADKARYY